MKRLQGEVVLDVAIRDPTFYEPQFTARLDNEFFDVAPMLGPRGQIRHRLELWAKGEVLHEPSEALFAGQAGYLRLALENASKKPMDIRNVRVSVSGPISCQRQPAAIILSAGESGAILSQIKVRTTAKPGLYDGTVSFQAGNRALELPFKIAVYRMIESRKDVRISATAPTEIELDMMLAVETPWGFRERLQFRQSIQIEMSEERLVARSTIREFTALAQIPEFVAPATLASWRQPVPATLLTHFYSIGETVRTGFGIATGAAAAGFAAIGAEAAKAALMAILTLILSPILSPYSVFVVGIFLLTLAFEKWWTVFISVSAGMSGREINMAIWDKLAEVFA